MRALNSRCNLLFCCCGLSQADLQRAVGRASGVVDSLVWLERLAENVERKAATLSKEVAMSIVSVLSHYLRVSATPLWRRYGVRFERLLAGLRLRVLPALEALLKRLLPDAAKRNELNKLLLLMARLDAFLRLVGRQRASSPLQPSLPLVIDFKEEVEGDPLVKENPRLKRFDGKRRWLEEQAAGLLGLQATTPPQLPANIGPEPRLPS